MWSARAKCSRSTKNMQIDVKVTAERAKKVLKPTLLVIMAVVIAVLCCLAYYVISRPSPAQKITVWVSDVSFSYSEELQNDTLAAAQPYGIIKCTYVLRNPQDTYYGMAFSLSGIYSSDVFVMTRQEIESYAGLALFLPLEGVENGLEQDGKTVGIPLKEDVYLLYNANSSKSEALLRAVTEVIARYATKEG